MKRFFSLLACVALLLATSVATSAKDDRGEAFTEFDRLLPLATKSEDEANAKEVRKALEDKSPWVVMAAVEAIRQAEADKPGRGKVFLADVLALMKKDKEKLLKEELVTVNLLACLGKLVEKDEPDAMTVIRAIIDWQRWSENTVVRLRNMAEKVLFKLTEQDCTLKAETLQWWEWWMLTKANNQDTTKQPEKKSKTAPILFKEPMVGTRVIFVIDVSDSMKHPIHQDDLAKIKGKCSHLKLPDDLTPMALAKAELAHSIDKLRPEKGADGKPARGTKKGDPEARNFAIITYSEEVKLFTPGWVEASDKNCNSWMTEVEKLETEHTTNIHGGLTRSFGLSEAREVTPNPELDKDCLLTGAHTIVFLTDGYPTWSDDSTDRNEKDEFGNPIGNGPYCKRDNLIELARKLNRFRKVTINTVGIGVHDKKLMKAFANDSGGAYTDWECRINWK